jgi:hypothetical protein
MPSLARLLPQNHRHDGIGTGGRSGEVSGGGGMDGYISKLTRIEAIRDALEACSKKDVDLA